ncbi:MAG: hypothetical protein MPK06_08085 [Alphaproteobacteria bacterium]|nr:hypothetical protein [Alphaproteobacteria bacterium]MDA8004633.1 hypothetical protein [Alphaproteobacteria bacterium]MDA8006468.1 hypothetical protein [Alphaproteobacteria bacterium]MDA8013876.1 hypothetical protein [Alphaproteobacteria bacterium]
MTAPQSGHVPRSRRSWARFYAVQTLYALEITGAADAEAAMDSCLAGNASDGKPPRLDEDFFRALTRGVHGEASQLDAMMAPILSRRGTERRPEHLLAILLRGGAWEILHCGETDVAVVVNEYLNLAHYFGIAPGTSLLNATLKAVARAHREGYGDGDGDGDNGDSDSDGGGDVVK